jgi:hypothetical protein
MDRKNIPIILMLTTGAITCIITYVRQYSLTEKLAVLLGVMVLFLILGTVLEQTLNFFDRQNEKKRQEEGEVIRKSTESPEEGTIEAEANEAQR